MQPREDIEVEQALWEEAAEAFEQVVARPMIVPEEGCDCLGCQVARVYLLPFLPVTWH